MTKKVILALMAFVFVFLGGLLLELSGWRIHFALFSVLGAGLLWLSWADVGETAPKAFANARQQMKANLTLMQDKIFWSYCGCLGLSSGVFFGYLASVPLVAEASFGYSAAAIGAAMGAPPLGFMIGNLAMTRLTGRISLPAIMIGGRILTLVGLTAVALLWRADAIGSTALFSAMVFIGLGNGFSLPSGMSGSMSVRPDLAGAAAGLSGAVMLTVGALASSLAGWLLSDNGDPMIMLLMLIGLTSAAIVTALPAFAARMAPATG